MKTCLLFFRLPPRSLLLRLHLDLPKNVKAGIPVHKNKYILKSKKCAKLWVIKHIFVCKTMSNVLKRTAGPASPGSPLEPFLLLFGPVVPY